MLVSTCMRIIQLRKYLISTNSFLICHSVCYSSKVVNYYELLQISPDATQAQVKEAYYKLSKECHPDHSEGDAANFRAITDAYEVLGNVHKRKLYDKGMKYAFSAASTISRDDHVYGEHISSERKKPRRSGVGAFYERPLDAWQKEHYTKMFEKAQRMKHANYIHRDETRQHQRSKDHAMFVLSSIMCVFLCSVLIRRHLYENDHPKHTRP